MRSVKVHWVVGFKQKQWLPENNFQNIIHFKKYNWTKYALCESTLSGEIQLEAMPRRRSFLKHYTHSNIQVKKVCSLWNFTAWWASSRSNVFQMKFFETLYTFKHTPEQSMPSVKVHWVVGFKQRQWFSKEDFQNIIHIQTYNWTMYALCETSLRGGLQAEAMSFRWSFLKHYTHSNIHLNKVCLLWKYTEWWASSRGNGFRRSLSKHYTHANIQLNKVCLQWKYTEWWASSTSNGFRRSFSKHYTHANIQLNKICTLWKYTEWWDSFRSNASQKKFFETLYTFKHTIEESMLSVKVQWVMRFRLKQWVSEDVFQNLLHIQTHTWTKYAFCEKTPSVGLQAEAMDFRRIFSKHYTHSNIQLNKVCILWKCTEWWASRTSNGFQRKFFKTLYTFKNAIEQRMRSVKVHWVVGFKQKHWFSEELFPHIIHIQTYNLTKYALCESTLSGWLQAEAMASRK